MALAWHPSRARVTPTGYDEEQVPTFTLRESDGMVWVATPPAMPGKLIEHKPSHLLDEHPKPANANPRVLGISTTAMDDDNPRFSTSDALLEHALAHALAHASSAPHADTQLIRLRKLAFRHCEGNYSKAARACTWPCAITERDPADQLAAVYEGLVHWADVVIIGTPIRWGRASSLYFKMTERHTRGWDAEDMENNVRLVKASDALRSASADLVERSLTAWRLIDASRAEMTKPMPRTGRKAQRLNRPGEVTA